MHWQKGNMPPGRSRKEDDGGGPLAQHIEKLALYAMLRNTGTLRLHVHVLSKIEINQNIYIKSAFLFGDL